MSLLGFFAICITVTGLFWLVQLLQKGSHRIDINVAIKPRKKEELDSDEVVASEPSENSLTSIMGEVVSMGKKILKTPPPLPTTPSSAEPVQVPATNQKTGEEQLASVESGQSQTAPSTIDDPLDENESIPRVHQSSMELNEDPVDLALKDENFDNHSNDSLMLQFDAGQPALGMVTFSAFGKVMETLPEGVFSEPQSREQIDNLFAAVQGVANRVEEQMKLMFALQQQMLELQQTPRNESLPGSDNKPSSGSSVTDPLADDDDELSGNSGFGGGLTSQLGEAADEHSDGSGNYTMSMEEAGGQAVDPSAFETHDLKDVEEKYVEPSYEILPYFHCLNKTGELAHEVVQAVLQKKSRKLVKHHVRQVVRAIEHFNLSRDSNLAVRLTAVFSQLPPILDDIDLDISGIGRIMGLSAPLDELEPVEFEDE